MQYTSNVRTYKWSVICIGKHIMYKILILCSHHPHSHFNEFSKYSTDWGQNTLLIVLLPSSTSYYRFLSGTAGDFNVIHTCVYTPWTYTTSKVSCFRGHSSCTHESVPPPHPCGLRFQFPAGTTFINTLWSQPTHLGISRWQNNNWLISDSLKILTVTLKYVAQSGSEALIKDWYLIIRTQIQWSATVIHPSINVHTYVRTYVLQAVSIRN